MKNKTKGLIALIAMTAATAVAAGSSTFAWFQTNRNANLKFNKITIAKRGSNELKAELLNLGLENLSADKQSLTVAADAQADASDISSKDGVQLYAPVWGNKVGDAQKVSKIDEVIDETNSHANKWFTEFGFKLTNVKHGTDTTQLNVFFNDTTLVKAVDVNAEHIVEYRAQVETYENAVKNGTIAMGENMSGTGAVTYAQYQTAKPVVVQQDKNDAAASWSRVAIIAVDSAPVDHAALGSSSTLHPTGVLTFENKITTEGNSSEEFVKGNIKSDKTMDIGTYDYDAGDRHYYSFADPETYYDNAHTAYAAGWTDDAKKGYLVTLDPDTGDDANTKYYVVRVWLEGTENDDQDPADGGEIELNLGFTSYGIAAE